jgi:hypothetical protein
MSLRRGTSSIQERKLTAPATTVTNPPAWLIQLFSRLQKAEEDVKLLADARNDEDAMEIDISHLRDYYETLSKNASELFWEITQDATLQNALTQERFNIIVKDCQMFGHEIWTAIGSLRHDTIGKENAEDKRMNRINTDFRKKNLENLKAAMHKLCLIRKWKRSETSTSILPHEKQCLKI